MTEPVEPGIQAGSPLPQTKKHSQVWARLAAALELPFSRRGLGVLFLLLAAGFVTAGWLRPPLSRDLTGLELPLTIGQGQARPPEESLYGPHQPLVASLGVVLLAVIAAGVLVVLWRPRSLGLVAGVLLCAGLAANAAAIFNYPALVELLDLESEQRQHMITVLPSPTEPPPLARKSNGRSRELSPLDGRVGAAPTQDQEWGGLFRGWVYLQYAPYLVYLAAAGVLLGTRGLWARRLGYLALWVGVGAVLAGAVCWPRLLAEFHWNQAKLLETQCNYQGARQELSEAVALVPEFSHMQRTWVLTGRLDYREGRTSPQETFFRAFQHTLNKDWPQALAVSDELWSGPLRDEPAIKNQVARTSINAGLFYYRALHDLASARDLWERAFLVAPQRRDTRLLLGVVLARMDPNQPDRVEASLAQLLDSSLADQPLRADCIAVVGNAYFDAAKMKEARRRYALSLDLFTLPATINYRAAQGLGGL